MELDGMLGYPQAPRNSLVAQPLRVSQGTAGIAWSQPHIRLYPGCIFWSERVDFEALEAPLESAFFSVIQP